MNNEKADLFYSTLDNLPVFKGPVAKEDRSKMNAVFVMEDPNLEKKFLEVCKQEGLYGVKGHRSCWRFQGVFYNALPLSSVEVLGTGNERFCEQGMGREESSGYQLQVAG